MNLCKNVPFNSPPQLGCELEYLADALSRKKLCGDGYYSQECHKLLESKAGALKAFLTTSGSSSLEMSALLAEINPGDEVIVPSFSFVTSASAFVLRGARLVYADIREDTQNIDETKLEEAITAKTKAIVLVHYGGVSCEMDAILALAGKYSLFVIEDAAQGIGSWYKDRMCGSMGDLGCYSFHETKNISCGEGGALLVNNPGMVEKAEIVREKGTNRSKFFRGQVDKYTWVDLGSSYLPSDLLAAYLYPQLLGLEEITARRMRFWNSYYEFFEYYECKGLVRRPVIPVGCRHNAHIFYLLLPNLELRTRFLDYMKARGVGAVFHYIPLHSSPYGKSCGYACPSGLSVTQRASDTLARMPLYYNLDDSDFAYVLAQCERFFKTV